MPAALSQREPAPDKDGDLTLTLGQENARDLPIASALSAQEEYHSAIRGLGSAQTRLHGLSQPHFSGMLQASLGSKSALVPEEEYMADDWLEDDLEEVQPKKKRRLRVEHNGISRDDSPSLSSPLNSRHRHPNGNSVCRGWCLFFVESSFCFLLKYLFPFLIHPTLLHFCCSFFHCQQESLSEKEWRREAAPGENDSDARDGQTGETRGQQVAEPHGDR